MIHVVPVPQVDIVVQAGHYPFLDQPLVFLGQVLRQTAAAFPDNAAGAAARAAAAAATPVTAATPQQISEWLDQWCGRECLLLEACWDGHGVICVFSVSACERCN